MRYRDIKSTASSRFRLPASHPILAEITIDPAHWYDFSGSMPTTWPRASSGMIFSTTE